MKFIVPEQLKPREQLLTILEMEKLNEFVAADTLHLKNKAKMPLDTYVKSNFILLKHVFL